MWYLGRKRRTLTESNFEMGGEGRGGGGGGLNSRGGVAQRFRATDLKSGGPWFKLHPRPRL